MLGRMTKIVVSVLALSLLFAGVASAQEEQPPKVLRAAGEIASVDPGASTFVLQTRAGKTLSVVVGESTVFRSRDGSIQGIDDLQPGMIAVVAGMATEDGTLTARMVAASLRTDLPDRLVKVAGEITQVVPGQSTFYLTTREGREVTIVVTERTRFRSQDGSVQDIHDLKKGMRAVVAGVRQDDGSISAWVVGVAVPKDKPLVDVRAKGRIVSLGDSSFTLQARDGRLLTFTVNGSTVYRSPDGSVQSFADLQVGMLAGVGAKEQGNGELRALLVIAGWPPSQSGGTSRPSQQPSADV